MLYELFFCVINYRICSKGKQYIYIQIHVVNNNNTKSYTSKWKYVIKYVKYVIKYVIKIKNCILLIYYLNIFITAIYIFHKWCQKSFFAINLWNPHTYSQTYRYYRHKCTVMYLNCHLCFGYRNLYVIFKC